MEKQNDTPDFLETGDARRIACRRTPGASPALVFLPGYASDMAGAKATAVARFAQQRGLASIRFDYSGTGLSGGDFEDGTLAAWLDEALAVIDRLTEGPVILLGSSMGGWIALHLALRRPGRIAALVGIAAAPDFTEWGFTESHKRTLAKEGRLELPNPYDPAPHVTTRAFWESGQQLRLLDAPIGIGCPVRLVHGSEDSEVPLAIACRLMQQLRSGDVQLQILKGGGHRLSEPHEIDAILHTIEPFLELPE